MLVEKTDVLSYIPQRAPMVMVDGLLEFSDEKSVSRFLITKGNVLLQDGFFSEAGLIENMAQSAALMNGYKAFHDNEKVKIGFIGAVKKLKVYELPEVGSTIETTITVKHVFEHASLVRAEIRNAEKIIAESELSIFTQE